MRYCHTSASATPLLNKRLVFTLVMLSISFEKLANLNMMNQRTVNQILTIQKCMLMKLKLLTNLSKTCKMLLSTPVYTC